MIIKSKIVRDTALLTIMQLILDMLALMLNVFITKQIGSSAIGILSLMGSFLGLAGIVSNGNAFICTSRLVSEEIGKPIGDPNAILLYGVRLCLILSMTVSAVILIFANGISQRFFSGANMITAIRFMPIALVSGAVSACIKGYFNARRNAAVAAVSDIVDFVIKCGVIVAFSLFRGVTGEEAACAIMISGIIAGNCASMVYLIISYICMHKKYRSKCSITFREYVEYTMPIMGGGILTAVLSSTNDALIPICLRMYGDSAGGALGKFGIFEAIVIPTLFFPSVVLCSISGIVVSEVARASAGGKKQRIKYITERLNACTLMFSVFTAAVIMRFGNMIGEKLGGGDLAGLIITMIAPVIPFIYMEIVLEAIIKGMGLQSFSSVNYLLEYIIRIAIVVVLIPRIGFFGIVVSYYVSNIFGNSMRFVKVIKVTGARTALCGTLIFSIILAFGSMSIVELFFRLTNTKIESSVDMLFFGIIWGGAYFVIFSALGKVKLFSKCGEEVFVETVQQTVSRVI